MKSGDEAKAIIQGWQKAGKSKSDLVNSKNYTMDEFSGYPDINFKGKEADLSKSYIYYNGRYESDFYDLYS